MKYILLQCALFTLLISKAQNGPAGDIRGQATDDSKPVEYLIEDTKLAHLTYSNFASSNSAELNIYVSKGMPDIYGKPVYTIEFSGSTLVFGNRTEVEGDIYEPELDRSIHALRYIMDTLVINRPNKKVNYFLNLGLSQFSISATYDPDSKKDGWKIALYLDRRNPDSYMVNIELKDLDGLIKALEMGRDKINSAIR